MELVGKGLERFLDGLAAEGDDASKKAVRAAMVNVMWENAVKEVYKDEGQADYILDHVNAVYIMSADAKVKGAGAKGSSGAAGEGTQLVVYSDDSMVRSDLDARQEFLKMRLREQGEQVESFKIIASRFDMKDRHPFRKEGERTKLGGHVSPDEGEERESLSKEGCEDILKKVGEIEDPSVREALKKAVNSLSQSIE